MKDRRGSNRVIVFNHFAVPRGEAGGTRHVELFSRLRDWEYVIIAADKSRPGERVSSAEPGLLTVPTVGFNSNGPRRVLNWLSYCCSSLWAGLRQGRVDVVYASSPHLLAGLSGLILAKVRRVPFVLEVRDLWPHILVHMGKMSSEHPVYRALTLLEELLYRHADKIVAMAPGTEVDLVGRGISAGKIAYIPNGADPEDFTPSAHRSALREKYGFTRLTAIYAGAHGPANGLDLLLEAAEEVADLPIDIVLVGSGVTKNSLQKAAKEKGLSQVRFLDPVPKTEIVDLLYAADLGLHVLADVELFRTAVSPNKLFDYMAAGLPVVTNSPGLVGDLVTESQCGWSVAPTQLASGLRAFASESVAGRVGRGKSGQDWIREHQSRSAMAERVSALLSELSC